MVTRRGFKEWIVGQKPATIVWFRNDLRVHDHQALSAAAGIGPVVPVFILDDGAPWPLGGAAKWWLHHSLVHLAATLRALGSPLIFRRGPAAHVLRELIHETGAARIHVTRNIEAKATAYDACLAKMLPVPLTSFDGLLLHDPQTLRTGNGGPYRVFTPFFRALRTAVSEATPLAAPASLEAPSAQLQSDDLAEWRLTPRRPDWAAGFANDWSPGETGARTRLANFLASRAATYAQDRDIFAKDGTSRLSPHLRFGEISPRTVWRATQTSLGGEASAEKFLSEVGWREFSYHLLHHFPGLPEQNLRREFDGFPWTDDASALAAWTSGRTGAPIVDAGMRELWATGWMHNRARMICASYLVKNLMTDWRRGASWFWDTLVDADLANNSASWQWVAGCGADAAPFFRIFNPMLQGQKFDPHGVYVRRWVPELTKLSDRDIHAPWLAAASSLRAAGVVLGETYPRPLVDLNASRARALAAFSQLSNAA
jgi:deoxyribodipyrimidine photo-lyase